MPTATATKPQVSAEDWKNVKAVAKVYDVDPYLLVAIGMHETGWGTQGDGRPPGNGHHGNILGVGSFDGGSVGTYSGLAMQLVEGAHILHKNGVHTIADVQAGKLHVQNGSVKWASADTASAGYPWSTSVVNIATRLEGAKVYDTGKLPTTSSAYDNQENRNRAIGILLKTGKILKPDSSITGDIGNTVGATTGAVTGAVSGVVSGITSVGDFLHWFTDSKNLLRIAEVVGGILLLVMAAVALIKDVSPLGQLSHVAGKLGGKTA